MPNIVLRNLGVAGRQLPLAMLSQWRDFIQNIIYFPCITILPKIYLSYLILYAGSCCRPHEFQNAAFVYNGHILLK